MIQCPDASAIVRSIDYMWFPIWLWPGSSWHLVMWWTDYAYVGALGNGIPKTKSLHFWIVVISPNGYGAILLRLTSFLLRLLATTDYAQTFVQIFWWEAMELHHCSEASLLTALSSATPSCHVQWRKWCWVPCFHSCCYLYSCFFGCSMPWNIERYAATSSTIGLWQDMLCSTSPTRVWQRHYWRLPFANPQIVLLMINTQNQ